MNELIENFFNTNIPQEVWHYTSIAGLEGILLSGAVWATEARYTTDPSEFVHARDVAVEFLKGIEPKDKHVEHARQATIDTLMHDFESGTLSPLQTEVFVASFSASSDLESQWEKYADGFRGVSIGFDLREIRPPSSGRYAVTFAPCIYDQKEKEALLKTALDEWVNKLAHLHHDTSSREWAIREWHNSMKMDQMLGYTNSIAASAENLKATLGDRIAKQLHEALTNTSFDLLRIASHCKASAFKAEHEWRLSLPRRKNKPLVGIEVLYRGADNQIPYLASNLFKEKLPITRVLVGPACDEMPRVLELLETYGHSVTVARIELPKPAQPSPSHSPSCHPHEFHPRRSSPE